MRLKRNRKKDIHEYDNNKYIGNLSSKRMFNNTMEFAMDLLKNEDKENSLILLDYLIGVIKKDLEYSMITEIIYKEEHKALDMRGGGLMPISVYDKNNKLVDNIVTKCDKKIYINKDSMVVIPWSYDRFSKSVKTLSKAEFEFQENNHYGRYYDYIDISYVVSGRHSVSSGIGLNKNGYIEIKEKSNTRLLFKHIYSDGVNWINIHNGKIINKLFDYRIGILFELARLKYIIESNR